MSKHVKHNFCLYLPPDATTIGRLLKKVNREGLEEVLEGV